MKTGLTLIQTYGNPESAHIDAGMLRSNGIACEVVESCLLYTSDAADEY